MSVPLTRHGAVPAFAATSQDRLWLFAILGLALALRVYVIWTQLYVIAPDETFQYLEPAHRLVFGDGVKAWEYFDGIRSWLLPGLAAGIMSVSAWFTDDPLAYLRLIRLAAALLALTPVYVGFRLGERCAGTAGAVLTGTLCAVWFELIYFAPIVMTEVISAHVALLAIYLSTTYATRDPRHLILAGMCLGLAICMRFQYGPALFGAMLVTHRLAWRRWRLLLLGALPTVLLVGGLLDTLTWGLPFQSLWLNLVRNMLQGISSGNSVEPWFHYLQQIWWIWQAALLLGVFAVVGMARFPAFAVTALLVLATHTLIGHKEYRFIYLALAIAPILIGVGLSITVARLHRSAATARRPLQAVPFVLVPVAALSFYIATHGIMPRRWTSNLPTVQAFLAAHAQPDLCGLGVKGAKVLDGGGYTYLHRDVPIFFANYHAIMYLPGSPVPLRTAVVMHGQSLPQYPGAELSRNSRRYNYLIADAEDADPGYDPVACFSSPGIPGAPPLCLFRRSGACL